MNLTQLSDKLQSLEKVIQSCQEKKLIGKLESYRIYEHPLHLKKKWEKLRLEMSKYKMQDVDCIARRDVFLSVCGRTKWLQLKI